MFHLFVLFLGSSQPAYWNECSGLAYLHTMVFTLLVLIIYLYLNAERCICRSGSLVCCRYLLAFIKVILVNLVVTREHSYPIKNEIVNAHVYFTEIVLQDQRLLESI